MILQPRLYAGAFLFPCVAFCVTLYRAFILQGYTVPGNTNTAGNTAAPGGFPRWAATLLQYTQILILNSRPGWVLLIVPGRVPGVVLCWLGVGAVWACMGRFKAVLLCGHVGVGVRRFRALCGVLCGVGAHPVGDLRQPPSREGVA